jgi:hypothetical protein
LTVEGFSLWLGKRRALMDLTTVNYRKVLFDAVEAYCKRLGISPSGAGKKLMNDRRFFTDMRDNNRGCTVDTFQRLMREMSEGVVIETPKKELTISSRSNVSLRNSQYRIQQPTK